MTVGLGDTGKTKCVTNEYHEQLVSMLKEVAIPRIIRLMKISKNFDIIEQSVWSLGNISSINLEIRDLLLDAGFFVYSYIFFVFFFSV